MSEKRASEDIAEARDEFLIALEGTRKAGLSWLGLEALATESGEASATEAIGCIRDLDALIERVFKSSESG